MHNLHPALWKLGQSLRKAHVGLLPFSLSMSASRAHVCNSACYVFVVGTIEYGLEACCESASNRVFIRNRQQVHVDIFRVHAIRVIARLLSYARLTVCVPCSQRPQPCTYRPQGAFQTYQVMKDASSHLLFFSGCFPNECASFEWCDIAYK
jgi:hypothetical protein